MTPRTGTGRRWTRLTPTRAQRLTLSAGVVTTAAGWIWYLLYLVADVPVTVSAHLLTSVTGVSSWLAFFPILTSREVPQEVKRFWTLLAYAVGGLTLSNTTGAVYLVYRYDGTGTVPMRPPVWSMAALMLALLIVGWALLQLPDGMTSRAERARLILDGAVVVIAVGAFLWHFVFSGVIANADRQSTVLAAGLFAVASVVVAAVVKVMLAGTRPVSAAAVRTLGVVPLVITVPSLSR